MQKNNFTKGIILAGGNGTRLFPLTHSISKQILPIYDKPMIYYPLSVLMLSKIRDVLIISSLSHIDFFKKLFGKGEYLGMNISYKTQDSPRGIPEAFIIGEKFINEDGVCLILGDNIFYGEGFTKKLEEVVQDKNPTVFTKYFEDPSSYGVAKYNKDGNLSKIIEKPRSFISNYAVTGLYFYDSNVVKLSKQLKPSNRGELEITDLNNFYIKKQNLNEVKLGRAFHWYDTGTIDSYNSASEFIKNQQKQTGNFIGCVEEIALKNKWITKKKLAKNIKSFKSEYYKNLNKLIQSTKF